MQVNFWFFSKMVTTSWKITKENKENVWSKIYFMQKEMKEKRMKYQFFFI